MKHFYDPADRTIQPPTDDDPNNLSLPADSYEPDDNQTSTSYSGSDNNGESNSAPVPSPDPFDDLDVYATERILKSRNGTTQYLAK